LYGCQEAMMESGCCLLKNDSLSYSFQEYLNYVWALGYITWAPPQLWQSAVSFKPIMDTVFFLSDYFKPWNMMQSWPTRYKRKSYILIAKISSLFKRDIMICSFWLICCFVKYNFWSSDRLQLWRESQGNSRKSCPKANHSLNSK
jgi:hypothetical protein